MMSMLFLDLFFLVYTAILYYFLLIDAVTCTHDDHFISLTKYAVSSQKL